MKESGAEVVGLSQFTQASGASPRLQEDHAMNVLITAGGTIAPIDDVRQIANVSTGRLGASLAEAALDHGADVWYLHTPTALRPFDRLARFDLDADPAAEAARLRTVHARWQTLRDRYHPIPLGTGTMAEYTARLRELLLNQPLDVAILAMAASDYAPVANPGKLSSDADELVIRCARLPKLIAEVRDLAPTVYLVGFKLAAGVPLADLIDQATRANQINRADLTVANDLTTVRAGTHTIHLVRPGQAVETYGPPDSIAERLVGRVFDWATASRAARGPDAP